MIIYEYRLAELLRNYKDILSNRKTGLKRGSDKKMDHLYRIRICGFLIIFTWVMSYFSLCCVRAKECPAGLVSSAGVRNRITPTVKYKKNMQLRILTMIDFFYYTCTYNLDKSG